MKGVTMKLTESQVKEAIERWYNVTICRYASCHGHSWHHIESMKIQPHSEEHPVSITFGESEKC